MSIFLEKAARFYNTYLLAQSLQEANQKMRILTFVSNPLKAVTTKISQVLAEMTFNHVVKDSKVQQTLVEHITHQLLTDHSQIVNALDLADHSLNKTGHFFEKMSHYDPSKLTEIVTLLCEDMALNLNDIKNIVYGVQAFNRSLDRIQAISDEMIGGAIKDWNERKQKLLNEQFNQTLKQQEDFYSQTQKNEAGILAHVINQTSWCISNFLNTATFNVKSISHSVVGEVSQKAILAVSQIAIETIKKPQKAFIQMGVNKTIHEVSKKAIYYPLKFGTEALTFYVYQQGIHSIFHSEEEENNSTWTYTKTVANVSVCALACIYYGNSIYQWKKLREKNIKKVKLFNQLAKPIIPMNQIDDMLHKIQKALAMLFNQAENEEESQQQASILNQFLISCREIIEQEFELILEPRSE